MQKSITFVWFLLYPYLTILLEAALRQKDVEAVFLNATTGRLRISKVRVAVVVAGWHRRECQLHELRACIRLRLSSDLDHVSRLVKSHRVSVAGQ